MTKVNLGYDVKDEQRGDGNDLIAAGNYLLEIKRATFIDEKDGKAAAVLLTLKVLEAEVKANEQYVGDSFLDSVTLHVNAAWRMAQFLDAVYGKQVEGDNFDTDDLLEKKIVAQTKQDEYNGKVRTRVERFSPLSKWAAKSSTSKTIGGTSKSIGKAAPDEDVDL